MFLDVSASHAMAFQAIRRCAKIVHDFTAYTDCVPSSAQSSMMNFHLRLSEEPPMPPEDADLSFTIKFKKGEGNPRRVFDAASELISSFEMIDRALALSIDETLEPLLVLEDVEASSLKVWLKNVLLRTDDSALKDIDWKPLVGRYLVRAKYLVLEYCDRPEASLPSSLPELKGVLRRLAEETDVRYLPAYSEVNGSDLVKAMNQLQKAKTELEPGDTLTVESEGKSYKVNLSQTEPLFQAPTPEPFRQTGGDAVMILTVRKPDMLKNSKWQFMHGPTPVAAAIEDEEWLERYHNRQVPLFPGDALRCSVSHVYEYDADNMLIGDKITIKQVLERIPGQPPQTSLF